ncbi:MAG: ComEC/Rec2 family competence protein, partial [Campylobacterales bacterium]|nr:ComEC/Rec2 family competence protein [Campylobacterales bacterium]
MRLTFVYIDYKDFIAKPFYFTDAKIISSKLKTKNENQYNVIKAKSSNGLTFFTVFFDEQIIEPNSEIRVQLFPNENIGFFDYLGTFFVNSKIKKITIPHNTSKSYLNRTVRAIHQDERV